MRLAITALCTVLAVATFGCKGPSQTSDAGVDGGEGDAGVDAGTDAGVSSAFCKLPGAHLYTASGTSTVAGGHAEDDFSWLLLPPGFCVHEYANVPNARQLRFAPGGELFVASPTAGTTGGGSGGLASIQVIPDDDHDGYGDAQLTFKSGIASTQGMMFANGSFYYQDGRTIFREPYSPGQRADNGQGVPDIEINYYSSSLHWPKTLDISDSGKIYVANGGDQSEVCEQPMPTHGAILEAGGTPCDGGAGLDCGATPIVKGLRNPIAIKCHRDGHDHCFADELGLDYSASEGGREELLPIESGDNWGFPCCATTNLPFPNISPAPDCSGVTPGTNSFLIGNTPFGFDFEDTQFPAPWDHLVLIALHGEAGSWSGARIVAIKTDPATGLPLPSSTTGSMPTGHIEDFAVGWDDGAFDHGRPADIDFAPDGRMFVANDADGEIFWVAPIGQ